CAEGGGAVGASSAGNVSSAGVRGADDALAAGAGCTRPGAAGRPTPRGAASDAAGASGATAGDGAGGAASGGATGTIPESNPREETVSGQRSPSCITMTFPLALTSTTP